MGQDYLLAVPFSPNWDRILTGEHPISIHVPIHLPIHLPIPLSLSLSPSLYILYIIYPSIYIWFFLFFFLYLFLSIFLYLPIYLPTCTYEGFLERVYPKMMVSNGKFQTRMDDDWAYTCDLGNLHICIATTNHPHRRGNFNVAPAQALMEACGGDIEKCT